MNRKKQPERRTFLQDRFDILIRRQKSGKATFSELTELDEIVNRDPQLREKVIRERMLMEGTDEFNEPMNSLENKEELHLQHIKQQTLLARMKDFLSRLFISKMVLPKHRVASGRMNQIALI